MKKITSQVFMLLFCAFSFAQVGLGTTTPSAELDIVATNTGIPALELTPQTSPAGTATGQLAVIGDRLYMYDATRSKWLTTDIMPISFGRSGDLDVQSLRSTGNVGSQNAGPVMPFNGTIVAITANSNSNSGTTNPTKELQVRVRNGIITQSTIDFNLVASSFNDATYDIDFNAGDHIVARVRDNDASGDTVSNPSIVVWVRWRQ